MKKRQLLKATAIILAAVVLLVAVGGGSILLVSLKQNQTIHVTPYTVSHPEIPAAFDGKTIVQLSDLHNKDWGDQLTTLVAAAKPDIIVITGDWISYDDTDITVALAQLDAIKELAPIYYVAGNHEAAAVCWVELYKQLLACGVTVMERGALYWEEDGEIVQIIGAYDTDFPISRHDSIPSLTEEGLYSIYLQHRPDYFDEVADGGVDLMISGHTHGGQVRLPLIGSVYAPNQGWFPRYDVGRFERGDATLIVSQGLGESAFIRILTPPELVVITLQTQ